MLNYDILFWPELVGVRYHKQNNNKLNIKRKNTHLTQKKHDVLCISMSDWTHCIHWSHITIPLKAKICEMQLPLNPIINSTFRCNELCSWTKQDRYAANK